MMIGRTRLGVGPLRDLAQLEATIAFLRRIPGVGAVSVDAFQDRRALLALQVLRPIDLPTELRTVLGARLRSCELGADRVEVELTDVPRSGSRVRAATAPGVREERVAERRGPAGRRDGWVDPSSSPWAAHERARDAVDATVVVGDDGGAAALRAPGSPFGAALRGVPAIPPTGAGVAGRPGRGVDAPDPVAAGAEAVRRAAVGTDALERAAGAADLILSALESMTDVSILVFDRDTRFCASAGSALKRHGHRHRDVVGRCAPEVLSADVWARLRPGYEAALRGGATTLVHRAADGAVYEIEFRPVREGTTIVGGIAISRDVTTRAREGARPTEAGELYELSFDRAPIAKALISPDGRWLRVNERLCGLLGRDEASMVRCGLQELTHPDDVASDAGLGREVLDGLRTGYAVEKRYLHAAGHVVPARLEVSLVRAPDGRPRWFVFEFVALPSGTADRPRLPVGTCVG